MRVHSRVEGRGTHLRQVHGTISASSYREPSSVAGLLGLITMYLSQASRAKAEARLGLP